MKRAAAVLAVVLLLAGPALAEMGYVSVSATATSQTINTPGATTMIVANDGANEVYIRVFDATQAPAAATTSNMEIKSGESIEIKRSRGIGAVSIVCASAETATARLFYD